MTDSLEQRLALLEASHEIAALVTRYAVACDEHDIDGLGPSFTQDAVFRTRNGSMQAGARFHWTHDRLIDFAPAQAQEATGVLFGHTETPSNGVHSIAALKYIDRYRLAEGAWRIAERAIHFLYYAPVAEYQDILKQRKRVVKSDGAVAVDFPENPPIWLDFDTGFVATANS